MSYLEIEKISAYGSGYKHSESIGGVTGSFRGAITKIGDHIKIEGYYKIHNNLYDFDLNSGGLSKRNAAVGIGRAGGVTSYILTGRMPYDYVMTFQGEVYINEEWDD